MAATSVDLENQVNRLLAAVVPQVFDGDDEKDPEVELLLPLKRILTNGEVELSEEDDSPATRCGKTLDVQEVAYCCRDCETDPTCVMCAKCFENSIHKSHQYRMITSAGGCCDCGDPEAWTDGVYCTIHEPEGNEAEEEQEDPLKSLPPVVVARGPAFFYTLLCYCLEMLHWPTEDKSLPTAIEEASSSEVLSADSHHVLLYNDEVHSYDEVIYALTHNLHIGHLEAVGLTTTVDRTGRCSVMKDTRAKCDECKSDVNKEMHPPLLKAMVLRSVVVSHQECALYLMRFMESLALKSAGLRRLLSEALLHPAPNNDNKTILDLFFLWDADTWKDSAGKWQNFVMHSIFDDPLKKKDLAVSMTKNYRVLLKSYSTDVQNRDVSATSISVQLFTTASMSRFLILEHHLFHVLLSTLMDLLSDAVVNGRLALTHKNHNHTRIAFCVHDMRYVLRAQPPGADEWEIPHFREKVLQGFKLFLNVLSTLEGVDAVKRVRSDHVEQESEWEHAINIWCLLQPVVKMMVAWCLTDKQVLMESVRMAKEMCVTSEPVVFTSSDPPLVDHSMARDPVTVHYPLARVLAGLCTAAHTHGLELPELLGLSDSKPANAKLLLQVLEKPLRSIVMAGQVLGGMWKRNGYSVLNQVFNYQFHFCQQGMYDMDVIMIKTVAATLTPHVFVHALLHKYRLQDWFHGCDNAAEGRNEPEDDSVRYLTTEAEEFLFLLIVVLGEHYFPGIGAVTTKDCLKREIIHHLFVSPLSHSHLSKHLKHYDEKEVGDALNEVAVFKRNAKGKKGVYELDPSFEKEHSLFFCHYTRVEQSKAEEAHRKKVKAAGGPHKMSPTPPPSPPPLCAPYHGILKLIHSRVLWQVLLRVFRSALSPSSNLCTDRMIYEALYLCGLMLLQEDASQSHSFSECATEPLGQEDKSLLQSLEALAAGQRADEHRPLLVWVIQQLQVVQKQQMGTPVDAEEPTDKPSIVEPAGEQQSGTSSRAQLAAEKRRRIMEQMALQQKSFLQKHRDELDNIASSPVTEDDSPLSSGRRISSCSETVLCAVGPKSLKIPPGKPPPFTCILCQGEGQEDEATGNGIPTIGAWVQRSTVLHRNSCETEQTEAAEPNFISSLNEMQLGIYTNSCGHTMHYDCWTKYRESKSREQRNRIFLLLSQMVEWLKGEFLCPLCQFHCNAVLPLLSVKREVHTSSSEEEQVSPSFSQWMQSLCELVQCNLQGKGTEEEEEEEEEGKISRVPGPACSTSSEEDQLTRLFPKYLKLQQKQGSTERSQVASEPGVSDFAQAVFTIGFKTDPNEEDIRVPTATWNTCSYTISCWERACSLKEKPFMVSLTDRNLQHFEALVRTVRSQNKHYPAATLAQHAQQLLKLLGFQPAAEDTPSILSIDTFSVLVNLHFAVGSLFQVVSAKQSVSCDQLVAVSDKFFMELVVCARMVQFFSSVSPKDTTESVQLSERDKMVVSLWREFRKCAGLPASRDPSQPDQLYDNLCHSLLPLLQSAALFFHCDTGIQIPDGEPGVSALCKFLALPEEPCNLFKSSKHLWDVVKNWCQHPKLQSLVKAEGSLASLTPKPRQAHMLSLPESYEELVKLAAAFNCGKSLGRKDTTSVLLCLLCGKLLCSNSYCCQTTIEDTKVGSFTAHVQSCASGFGIGLWIMECRVVLMNATDLETTRGCFLAAPYLDEFSESDPGLRRGRPLKLHHESLQELHDLWLSHGFAGKITKELEKKREFLAFPWNRL